MYCTRLRYPTFVAVAAAIFLIATDPAHSTGNYGGTPSKPNPPAAAGPSNSDASAAAAAISGAVSSSGATSTSGAAIGDISAGGGGSATAQTGPISTQSAGTGGTGSSTSDATGGKSKSVADATGGTSGSSLTTGDTNARSLALGIVLPQSSPTLPPMAKIECPTARIRQSASTGWVWGATPGTAETSTDPIGCERVTLINAKIESCQYADAQRMMDLYAAEIFKGYTAKDYLVADQPEANARFNLPPDVCAAQREAIEMRRIQASRPVVHPAHNEVYEGLRRLERDRAADRRMMEQTLINIEQKLTVANTPAVEPPKAPAKPRRPQGPKKLPPPTPSLHKPPCLDGEKSICVPVGK